MKSVVCHWCPCRRLIRLRFRHELKAERSELFFKKLDSYRSIPIYLHKMSNISTANHKNHKKVTQYGIN